MASKSAAKTVKKTAAVTRSSVKAPAKTPAKKAVVKPAAKAATKTAVRAPAVATPAPVAAGNSAAPVKTSPSLTAAKTAKVKLPAAPKAKKPKLVRDSFTMPEAEYQVLADLKKACIKAGFEVKKSELLRIAVAMMQKAGSAQLQAALAALPPLKAGRPKKSK